MAAILATARASPLGTVPSRRAATAAGESRTRPVAVALRAVTSFAETSTIRAWPDESRWVSVWPAPAAGWPAAGGSACEPIASSTAVPGEAGSLLA